MIDLAPRLSRLKALRPSLPPGSRDDLDLLIAVTEEAIFRPNLGIDEQWATGVLDRLLALDPDRMGGPLRRAGDAVRHQLAARAGRDG